MWLVKLSLLCSLVAVGLLPAYAADLEMQVVDKACWIEIFEDDHYDADDPHIKIQGPKDVATGEHAGAAQTCDPISKSKVPKTLRP